MATNAQLSFQLLIVSYLYRAAEKKRVEDENAEEEWVAIVLPNVYVHIFIYQAFTKFIEISIV